MIVAALTGLTASAAPQQGERSTRLDVVEVVGCLAQPTPTTWAVENATEPVVSKEPYTNEAALKAAGEKPLGTKRYALIAIGMFNPDAHKGHKVAVKGLLIKDAAGDRLNVTSLQMVSASCR